MDHAANPHTETAGIIAGLLVLLRALAEGFAEIYGAPSALARGGHVFGNMRERALRWLHDMECVARRLLLLRAMQFPPPMSAHFPNQGNARVARRKEGGANALFGPPDDPAQWRVHFSIRAPHDAAYAFAYDAHQIHAPVRRASHATQTSGPVAYYAGEARPLAERFEALLRVLSDPDAFAARLALRLHRWRGRECKRESLLRFLCAATPIANEAGLDDADWDLFGAARDLMLGLLPRFYRAAPALLDSG